VVDGDTVECADGVRVRLILIDAPEAGQGAYGTLAHAELERLLPPGTAARLELDVDPNDRYGRTLAYLYNGDRMINEELVRAGLAVIAVYPPNIRYASPAPATVTPIQAARG
jgi:micrococcal nuclease